MRRADRLFQIIQILRRRDLTTAQQLAQELEVSVRTVYRDIQDLVGSGVPIEGEAGVGYVLAAGYDLPPLMFNTEEIEALVLGTRMVACWGDANLSRAAQDVLQKVNAVLPPDLKDTLDATPLFVPSFKSDSLQREALSQLREAVRLQRKVKMNYQDGQERITTRQVRPLCLACFAPRWLLAAWCEKRSDFRNFRLDRIQELTVLEETFKDEPGRSLNDFIAQVTRQMDSGL